MDEIQLLPMDKTILAGVLCIVFLAGMIALLMAYILELRRDTKKGKMEASNLRESLQYYKILYGPLTNKNVDDVVGIILKEKEANT
jgi:hypothetical protein